jgi:hypothetical protein
MPATDTFRLAPMSGMIRVMTIGLFGIPVLFWGMALTEPNRVLLGWVGTAAVLLYAFIWFWLRPTAFVVSDAGLEIVWPARRRTIAVSNLVGAETVSREKLREEYGFMMRVGAGGLWGGFGLAWSSTGNHLGLYVSRHADGFVLVRCKGTRSLLITPEEPERFVAALSERAQGASGA